MFVLLTEILTGVGPSGEATTRNRGMIVRHADVRAALALTSGTLVQLVGGSAFHVAESVDEVHARLTACLQPEAAPPDRR